MRSYLYLAAFIGGNLGVGTAAFAQNEDGHTQNLYLAPFEVIENHPDCGDPGETAYEFDLNVRDVAYRLHQVGTARRNIYVNHNMKRTVVSASAQDVSKLCYRSVMRGVERIEFEVPCAPEPEVDQRETFSNEPDPLQVFLDESAPTFNLQVRMSICQSLTDFQLLESYWEAEVSTDGEQVVSGGELIFGDDVVIVIGDIDIQHRIGTQDSTLTGAMLQYSSDNTSYSWAGLRGVGSAEWTSVTNSRSVAQIILNCIPVPPLDTGIEGLYADTSVAFIPNAALPENCSAEACAVRFPSSEVYIPQSSRSCAPN